MKTLLIALLVGGSPSPGSAWLGLLVVPGSDEGVACAQVVAVAPSGPSYGKLATSDCIRSADGKSVSDVESLASAIHGKSAELVRLEVARGFVEVRLATQPANALEVLCEARKRGPAHVRVAFGGKNIEVDFQGRPTVADARKAVGASSSARAMINPRMQCNQTASAVMVDVPDATLLENNDWVIFLAGSRDGGPPRQPASSEVGP